MSSSGLYIVNDSFYCHSTTSEMADLQFFSKKPFSPFSDIDLLQLQAISNQQTYQNATDQNSPSLISSSSPSYQLETLKSHQAFELHSYGGAENAAKFMQMSYSSNCFDGSNNKPGFYFQPSFDSLMESPSFQNQASSLSSPESSFLDGQMRRVSSTVGCWLLYVHDEYACRKILADNRPRTRGRFARNGETGEILKAACSSTREEDEDELWVEGFNVEEEEMNATVEGGGQFMNNFGATQFQYYGF
ncbi:uncharacterized protein LOC125479929 [Pyrus x bretschneideri]|uniref:uncharacterized protein LOC125479929 n=1 Tax=Pyrus x bretschneideri TaxID=225117 RepID=UPI00202EB69E|nr:uncharacterized protein LOC125479929 [Pyrus x bretschneideri]